MSNKLRSRTRYQRKEHELNLASRGRDNPKVIWQYINSRTKLKTGIGKLCKNPIDPKSDTTDDDHDKAEILNSYFSSVLTEEPPGEVPTLEPRPMMHEMPDLVITRERVLEILLKLKSNKTPGIDEIPPLALKELANQLAAHVLG